MLTSNIFVLTEILYHAIEGILTNGDTCVRGNFFIDGLVGHSYQPVLVPEGAIARLPDKSADVAKLMTAT